MMKSKHFQILLFSNCYTNKKFSPKKIPSAHISHSHPSVIYCFPYGPWSSKKWLIPTSTVSFAFVSCVVFTWTELCDQNSKLRGSSRRWAAARSPREQTACCCADWKLWHTKRGKCGFQRPRACALACAFFSGPGRKEQLSQQER